MVYLADFEARRVMRGIVGSIQPAIRLTTLTDAASKHSLETAFLRDLSSRHLRYSSPEKFPK